MIKFFRRIRYDLIGNPSSTKASAGTKTGTSAKSSAKAGRYLKYAVGEIILVVIGILIALSINNWNDERKQANTKNKIVTALILDLEKDIKAFELNEERNQKSIDLIDAFLRTEQIENSQNFTNTIDQRYVFYPNSSKYKSIISTNQIELLDDSTVDKLTTYYEYDYFRLNARVRDLDNSTKRIEDYIINILPKHTIKDNDENFNIGAIKTLDKKEVYNLLSYNSSERKNLNGLVKSTREKAELLLIDLKKITKG